MAIKTQAVTATSTATLIPCTESDYIAGHSIEVTVPAGGVDVFVGGSDVAASGATVGRRVSSGQSYAFDCDQLEKAYVIVATGTQLVTVFAVGA